MKTWVPPPTLIIQPDALLVPGRVGYVKFLIDSEYEHQATTLWLDDDRDNPAILSGTPAGLGHNEPWGHATSHILSMQRVGIARWDLSRLTLNELESLAVAVDAQINAWPGTRRPATVAEQRALNPECDRVTEVPGVCSS